MRTCVRGFFLRLLSLLATASWGGTLSVDRERSVFQVDVEAVPLHSFSVEATDFQVEIELGDSGEILAARFSFEVSDLDSGIGKRNAKLRDWLEVDRFPEVKFVLNETRREEGSKIGVGTVWMHGEERQIEVSYSVVENEDGELRLIGEASFDYRDWDLEVISLLFLKVKPQLTARFELVGQPREVAD